MIDMQRMVIFNWVLEFIFILVRSPLKINKLRKNEIYFFNHIINIEYYQFYWYHSIRFDFNNLFKEGNNDLLVKQKKFEKKEEWWSLKTLDEQVPSIG